jgi:hypothetical protein
MDNIIYEYDILALKNSRWFRIDLSYSLKYNIYKVSLLFFFNKVDDYTSALSKDCLSDGIHFLTDTTKFSSSTS